VSGSPRQRIPVTSWSAVALVSIRRHIPACMGRTGEANGLDQALIAELVRRSTACQGLPELIEDRVVLARVAVLLSYRPGPIEGRSRSNSGRALDEPGRPLVA
jgi:hypothetical protein